VDSDGKSGQPTDNVHDAHDRRRIDGNFDSPKQIGNVQNEIPNTGTMDVEAENTADTSMPQAALAPTLLKFCDT
jgi:hypothetical protein